MKLYKLTDSKAQTLNDTQWGEGVTHRASGEGPLCGPGWLHAYEHPLLAALMNPIHANFSKPRLWEAEGSGEVLRDGQLKLGVTELTTVRELPLPAVTTEQKVKFAILCALKVHTDSSFVRWADGWLNGSDRSESAARTTAEPSAKSAAWAAVWAAEPSAESAAWAAVWAAEPAASVWAARAASRAASAWAARAAESARATEDIDLVAIAEEACK